jgi:hypothetical protein
MFPHNLSARCVAGSLLFQGGCVGHFDIDAVVGIPLLLGSALLFSGALSGLAKLFLCTADAPTPQNHVRSASDRTGDVRNSSQDQGDHQQGCGR